MPNKSAEIWSLVRFPAPDMSQSYKARHKNLADYLLLAPHF
ncbi:hypothetical protein CY0110_15917 [Crocosphaera chwakensis CCY0110]|uniref:Uncharacterized protein n=1 Tax=Crocosphaera chwakensis CCY0110 TaxID=391612 RepID=A3IHL5_9CHRO|nr:hypothetical protein CY0110_15917 [Crocosphaera chwakensis CCY0110]